MQPINPNHLHEPAREPIPEPEPFKHFKPIAPANSAPPSPPPQYIIQQGRDPLTWWQTTFAVCVGIWLATLIPWVLFMCVGSSVLGGIWRSLAP